MRVVIQRVSHASVTIEGVCKSAIKEGFMILVGIEEADTQEESFCYHRRRMQIGDKRRIHDIGWH